MKPNICNLTFPTLKNKTFRTIRQHETKIIQSPNYYFMKSEFMRSKSLGDTTIKI